jgi:hypothetical protein
LQVLEEPAAFIIRTEMKGGGSMFFEKLLMNLCGVITAKRQHF